MPAQHLRLSQFVITYGPGAILEGQQGPRVILRPDIGLFYAQSGITPTEVEISDPRMSEGLLHGARIFRLPSNAERRVKESRYLYRTKAFPSWSLCVNSHGQGQNRHSVLYAGPECPVCHSAGANRREAIRFIVACSLGHMDDVNWPSVVHRGGQCRGEHWFRWFGGGGSLNEVKIQCPVCGSSTRFGDAYGRTWFCSGRLPEREVPGQPANRPSGCAVRARIIQRQASNLRIPELRTLFTIPPRATPLHNLLQMRDLRAALAVMSPHSKQELQQMLERLHRGNLVSRTVMEEILKYSWEDIEAAFRDLQAPLQTRFGDLVSEEFERLAEASVSGYPRTHSGDRALFEVDPSLVRRIPMPGLGTFRVAPILRLQTITVQTGYTRGVSSDQAPRQVSIWFEDENRDRWYPGVQFLGEGLFLMLEEDNGWQHPPDSPSAHQWEAADPAPYPEYVFRDPDHRDELHPVFVWWHTLAHLLMRALSVDAGYSSAAVRERIYFQRDAATGKVRGGAVLYATQPGSEGSLGGLIALVPHIEAFLRQALVMAQRCSNDPLCDEHRFSQGQFSGAACYSCLLVSETSCEHRNLWLDRSLLA